MDDQRAPWVEIVIYIAMLVSVLIALRIVWPVGDKGEPDIALTPGPCVMLGLATADGLDGPHLVIDCDGTQFGVRAVMP